MQISIILRDLISRRLFYDIKDAGVYREILFIDHPDEMKARWQGISYDKETVREETGIEQVEYLERFEEKLPFFGRRNSIQHLYLDIANWEEGFTQNPAQRFAKRYWIAIRICRRTIRFRIWHLCGR